MPIWIFGMPNWQSAFLQNANLAFCVYKTERVEQISHFFTPFSKYTPTTLLLSSHSTNHSAVSFSQNTPKTCVSVSDQHCTVATSTASTVSNAQLSSASEISKNVFGRVQVFAERVRYALRQLTDGICNVGPCAADKVDE